MKLVPPPLLRGVVDPNRLQVCPDNIDKNNPANYDAFIAETRMGNIMRAIHARYPNIQQVFISTRIYGGYANENGICLNPEPFAFEYGIAVQRLVVAQIYQMAHGGTGNGDPYAGDLVDRTEPLGPPVLSPWIDWGPYLWANRDRPRSDNLLVWCNDPQGLIPNTCQFKEDFRNGDSAHGIPGDFTHPNDNGEQKVGALLLTFLKASLTTTPWFLAH